jgi:hypothetical protein
MSSLTPLLSDIQLESVEADAAASSGTVQQIAQMTQHYGKYSSDLFSFKASGPYSITSVPDVQVDGSRTIVFPSSIHAFSFVNHIAGSSGYTEIDLIKKPTSGPDVSIFTTKPRIDFCLLQGT